MQGFKRRVSKAGRANSRKRPREDDDTPGVSPPGAARQAPVLPSGSRLAGAVAQAREAKSLTAAFGSRSSALASGQDAPRVAPALPAQAGAADGTPSGRERPGKTFAAPMVDPVANAEAVKDDAIARFEARLSLHDEAKKRAAAPLGQRLYRGTDGYTDFRKRGSAKDAKSAAMAAGTIGPLRAATTVRSTFVTDFQKGLCKDYFETGYCGFGDTCIYMHDRSSRRAGWQVDRDWEASQKLADRSTDDGYNTGLVDHAGAPRPETVGDKAARLRNKATLTAHDHLKRLEDLTGVRQAFQRITEGAADAIAWAFHDAKQRKRCGDDRPLQAITQECVGRLRGGESLQVVDAGIAGGVKVADPSRGAFFKIAEDTVGIYGGSSVMADKAAKHELAMLTHLHEADAARLLTVPLASCVDVTVRDAAGRPERVYRVQGFSRHAVGDDTLRVGSGDGGNTTHVCEELDGVAEELAAGLHLAPSLKAPISGNFTRHEYRRVRGDRDPDGFPRMGPATDALLASVGAGRHALESSGVCAQVEEEHGVVLDPLRSVHAEHSATVAKDAGGVPTRLPFDVELHALPWGEVVLLDTHRLCIPDVTIGGAVAGGQVAVATGGRIT
ncbi:hypothetical protein FNF29_04766 [Cafeteria roenbergensis]|uniref:C3H1-type domain-containing protein n=1 Tax=Cafeteria roenbergensis TaxID=33653 RepID=A0A5A8CHG6_CAFRO|nr:hypothetical protein FNF29_04766 [Cafeteria roenbergensis]|eukprot:KAA0151291.1 hypothetical protein FNF29_04766 [Cafeteria roenbergensis]